MRKLIFFFLLCAGFVQAQTNYHLVTCSNIADMKAKRIDTKSTYLLINKTSQGDGMGGALYYWDSTSVETEDLTYINVIASPMSATGRFKRANVKTIILPQGTLYLNGGVKKLKVKPLTDINGETQTYLTYDNTATGTPIFTESPTVTCSVLANYVSTNNDIITGSAKTLTANFKTLVCIFARGNVGVLAILAGYRAPALNTPVSIEIEGL